MKIDETGNRYGRLVVVAERKHPDPKFARKAAWLCRCDCGEEKIYTGRSLRRGDAKSCGCLFDENKLSVGLRGCPPRTHGMTGTSIYKRWMNMKARCFDADNVGFKNYGGRGITVCERWLIFENFYADMGDPPEGKTLDRIDNDGNYEPGNCRWATPAEQVANRRCSRAKQSAM